MLVFQVCHKREVENVALECGFQKSIVLRLPIRCGRRVRTSSTYVCF
jgi:hypothetical protein